MHWREAWKHGERAFRSSQLDIGHALGWSARFVETLATAKLAAILGLDRADDFPASNPRTRRC